MLESLVNLAEIERRMRSSFESVSSILENVVETLKSQSSINDSIKKRLDELEKRMEAK